MQKKRGRKWRQEEQTQKVRQTVYRVAEERNEEKERKSFKKEDKVEILEDLHVRKKGRVLKNDFENKVSKQ